MTEHVAEGRAGEADAIFEELFLTTADGNPSARAWMLAEMRRRYPAEARA